MAREIKHLTDKLIKYGNRDILDIFLESPDLYDEILKSEEYYIDVHIHKFLNSYKSKK